MAAGYCLRLRVHLCCLLFRRPPGENEVKVETSDGPTLLLALGTLAVTLVVARSQLCYGSVSLVGADYGGKHAA